jgi:hypothetical protein
MATCPICKSDVEEIESGFIDGKTFRCAKHGEFQVSDSVLNVPALMDADTSQAPGTAIADVANILTTMRMRLRRLICVWFRP